MMDAFPAHESIRKRRRWGCTCGCLVFVLAVLIGGFGFLYYAFKPQPPKPEERWLNSSMNGFGIARLNQTDEGVADLTEFLLRRIEAQQKQGKPENEQKAIAAGMKIIRQAVGGFLHPNTYTYLTYDPNVGEQSLSTVQLKNNFSRLVMDLYITKSGIQPKEYAGRTPLYSLAAEPGTSGTVIASSSNAILISNKPEEVREAIERTRDPKARGQANERLQQFIDEMNLHQPPAGEDMAFAIVNEENRIEWLLEWVEKRTGVDGLTESILELLAAHKLAFSDMTGARASVDLQSAERARLELTFYCRQSDIARKFTEVFKNVLSQLAIPADQVLLTFRGDAKVRGTAVVVTIEIAGIKAWIESVIPLDAPAAEAEASQNAVVVPAEETKTPEVEVTTSTQ